MKTIETTIMVDESRQATIQFPADVAPGPHRVVVVIEGADDSAGPANFRGP
ncbi:MAG: hypothetical protein WBQ11_16790 [Isosphaeraceae bacterium]